MKSRESIKILKIGEKCLKFLSCLILVSVFFFPDYVRKLLSYFEWFKHFFEKSQTAIFWVAFITLIAFFLLNALISIFVRMLIAKIEKDNEEYLKNFGKILQAKIVDIEKNIDRKGEKYRLISLQSEEDIFEKTLTKDPFGYLDFGDTVNIFLDPEDKENYYIEVNELFDLPLNIARMHLEKWKQKGRFKFEE